MAFSPLANKVASDRFSMPVKSGKSDLSDLSTSSFTWVWRLILKEKLNYLLHVTVNGKRKCSKI